MWFCCCGTTFIELILQNTFGALTVVRKSGYCISTIGNLIGVFVSGFVFSAYAVVATKANVAAIVIIFFILSLTPKVNLHST